MKKYGFTFAEVLLTLAIIGVVAALTIPAVITKVTQDQYVVGLKKAYNTLKSVEREARQENGDISDWNWTTLSITDNFNIYWKPHFDVLKDCGATADSGCFHGANETKILGGGNSVANWATTDYYKFITSDGVAYAYTVSGSNPPQRRAWFVIDVNGKKGPNTSGRDMFVFDVFNNSGIKPHGALILYNENIKVTNDQINTDCNPRGSNDGWYCTTKVLSEGAMNY